MAIVACGKPLRFAYSKFAKDKEKKSLVVTTNHRIPGTSYLWVKRGGGKTDRTYYECNGCYNKHRAMLRLNKKNEQEGKAPVRYFCSHI